ncbi:MAG: aminoacetone oxidase family FAD-binding enzyme [Lachnospiraceae bacterium]|nr:aminoacetone oxidase family FAD-binding enzyme [Lachnospiraceae bacterium]
MKKRSIAVIGAGAAGMMAAIAAARAGAAVTIYEHRSEAGRKLLMTGNGKCNLTNTRMGMTYYYCGSEDGKQIVRTVLTEFDEACTLSFFHEIGLLTYDRDGYVYPQSEQAVIVRDVLVRECLFCGVNFQYDTDVYPLLCHEEATGQFVIGKERYDRLILACGGKSERQTGSDGSGYELAKRFGHRIITPLPALVPLYTNEPDWQSMAGVRAKARVCLLVESRAAGEAAGELQMTAQGISGIPVLELSRIAVHAIHEGKRVEAEICFLNGRDRVQIEAMLRRMLARGHAEDGKSLPDRLQERLTGTVNAKILSFILRRVCSEMERLHSGRPDEDRLAAAVAQQLFSCRIPINGHGKLDHAQVTSGGVLFDEVTEKLESRLCEGLFFAGEMLDVDGICGGYNLQWAWSSGYAAGTFAAGKCRFKGERSA